MTTSVSGAGTTGLAARHGRPIGERPTPDAPLSPAQHSVWIADDLLGGGGVYNLSHLTWLRGPFDLPVFGACLDDLVRRHEILRTTFAGSDAPRQVIHEPAHLNVEFCDLRVLPERRRQAEALRLAGIVAARSFNTARGPLLRVAVTRVGDEDHLLVLTLHHLLADEWALDILIGELSELYAARGLGRDADLPPLAIQFGDYAHWQSERLASGLATRQLEHWRQALSGVPLVLDLPTDKPRPPRPSHRGLRASRAITPELTAEFRQLATRHGVTAFTAMIAVFSIVLSRHAGQQSFAVGTATSGRNRTETESLIGLFANPVAIPLDVPDDASVAHVLRGTGAAVFGAMDHQDVPFERVLTELNAPRSMSRGPVFQVLVQWGTSGRAGWRLPGITTQVVSLPFGSAKADLTLVGVDGADSIEFELIGEAELFETSTLRRLLDHFVNALTQIVADPTVVVSGVDMIDAQERHLLTREWAGSVGDHPSDATLGELFEQIAEQHPHAAALAGSQGSLTYQQLEQDANRLAHLLRARGVGVDDRVGIALPRSFDLIVAMLAIVKAGGACLALDPANPPARNALLVSDADPAVVITTTANLPALATANPCDQPLILDDPAVQADLDDRPAVPPPALATRDSLAHICYTSGSTGTPKGVGLTHRGIVRLVRGHHPAAYSHGQTCLLLAPIAFDVSLMEVWGSLINGARLVVPPAGKLDIPDIAELLREYHVTTLGLITPMFHQLVQHDIHALIGVRNLLIGGDSIAPAAFAAPLRACPGLTAIACYGPTENTTITTSIATTDHSAVGARVPIGRPIPHTTAYVLDEHLRPAPIGVTGELHAGGHGVARGYLNLPSATADRFLPDPYSDIPGARMYRTGDLARWRETGVLDFLGRVDNQVKIRGFRIELGEIEACLTQHPRIAEAVAVARDDHSGHKRVLAYLVPAAGTAPDHTDLAGPAVKHFIQQTLPEYMTPASVTVLPRLPLTPHGKVDRAALPDPTVTEPAGTSQPSSPRTPAEHILVRIWQNVLGTSPVGIHDNFFDLGGDSILSIRIASEARQNGIPLTSAHLFDHQTIAELAEFAPGTAATGTTTSDVEAPEQHAITGDVPLTPIQHWFTTQGYAAGSFNQAVRLVWDAQVDPGALRRALDGLLTHHDALRLRLTRDGSNWRQHIAAPEAVDLLEVVDLGTTAEAGQEAVIGEAAARAQARVDVTGGPLLRAVLLRGCHGGDQVVIVIHHLAVDTVSWEFILEDLATAYQSLAAGQPVRLPTKTTSFQTWARELADRAASGRFADEGRFWQDYPGTVPPLPVDRPCGAGTVSDIATVLTVLGKDHTRALLRKVPLAVDAHINDVLLTALAIALRGWTGCCDHVIDLEGHGRQILGADLDVSRTVGWFTSIHPVRLGLPPTADPLECLAAVRDHMRTIPNRGTGYGVVRYLRSGQSARLASSPAQLIFNYHGQITSGSGQGPRRMLADAGPEIDPRAARRYLLEVTAAVRDESLRVSWTYPPTTYNAATVASIAENLITSLTTLIDSCSADGAPLTPAVPRRNGRRSDR
jgi:amino acid adenylation domain-containing protein/non-ribosomal peptide synthase protein (TIGR01720 family)